MVRITGRFLHKKAETAIAVAATATLLVAAGPGADATMAGGSAVPAVRGHGGPSGPSGSRQAAARRLNTTAYSVCANPNTYPPGTTPANLELAGWTNAAKLDGSAVIGFPLAAFAQSAGPQEGVTQAVSVPVGNDIFFCTLSTVDLDNGGRREFPQVRGTFLAFGIMPVTATVIVSQDGPKPVTAVLMQDLGPNGITLNPFTLVSTARVSLRVTNVKANGVPLNVGPDCRTTQPLYTPHPETDPANPNPGYIELTGGTNPSDPQPQYSNVFEGGALAGMVTIPPFTGCGINGENLDPLITASISGPGNYTKLLQGVVCVETLSSPNCGPDLRPVNPPLWTIRHGGAYAAAGSAPLTLEPLALPSTWITCQSSAVAGAIPDLTGPVRGDYGITFGWTGISDCTGPKVAGTISTWTVAPQGMASITPQTFDRGTGTVTAANGSGISLVLTETSPANCTVDVDLSPGGSWTYTNPPGPTLNIDMQTTESSTSGTCPPRLVQFSPAVISSYTVTSGGITMTSP